MSEQETDEPQQTTIDGDNLEKPTHCVVMLNSFLTSNATITLSEFRKNGIHDGYKYVPKADDVVPPYCIEYYVPEKNMNLAVITDVKLFLDDNPEMEIGDWDAGMTDEEVDPLEL